MRWSEVKDTLLDYTREQGGGNLWWIRTAQIICGAKLINENYYGFLIPTLQNHIDIFTCEDCVNYPLNHCLLSEDEKYLIILDNSEKQYKQTKLFYNCSVNPPVPLKSKEEERLAFSHPRFLQYIAIIQNMQLPLKKSSVLIFKELVESTLDERGLDPLMTIDKDQVLMAERYFMLFFDALNKLPQDELARVNDHRTYFRGTNFSVSELLFKLDNQTLTCFDPKQLFMGLSLFLERENYALLINRFLQDLISSMMQQRSDSMKTVHANVAFFKLIQCFEEDELRELFSEINGKKNVALNTYYDAIFSFLVLHESASITNYRLLSFFSPTVSIEPYRGLLLQTKPKDWRECHSISDIVVLVRNAFENILRARESNSSSLHLIS